MHTHVKPLFLFFSLQEWNLDSLDDHCAVFTFLDGELDLKVTFDQAAEQSFIQSVNLYSHISPGKVYLLVPTNT